MDVVSARTLSFLRWLPVSANMAIQRRGLNDCATGRFVSAYVASTVRNRKMPLDKVCNDPSGIDFLMGSSNSAFAAPWRYGTGALLTP